MSKRLKMPKSGKILRQVAALPYRLSDDRRLEILLVTTKFTRRFIIPKGWPKSKQGDAKSAAEEAEQEAGVLGEIGARPFDSYVYQKKIDGDYVYVKVDVFILKVTNQSGCWIDSNRRSTKWLSVNDAALLTDEPALVPVIRYFGRQNKIKTNGRCIS